MFDLSPYMGLIYLGVSVTALVSGLKVVLNSKFLKAKADVVATKEKMKIKGKGLIAQATDLIENADEKKVLIENEINHLREKGVTDQQMENLLFEKKMVDLAQHPVAKIAGGPIIQLIGKYAKGFGLDI